MDTKRRKLFHSFTSFSGEKSSILRPPYAKSEGLFAQQCVTCEGNPCGEVCEEGIIVFKDKMPSISFEKGGCTYCEQCAKVCPSEVLSTDVSQNINGVFSIYLQKCLAWNDVICYTCKDVCDENAIEFLGVFRPQIVSDRCTSCGFCYNPCPTDAIQIKTEELVCDTQ